MSDKRMGKDLSRCIGDIRKNDGRLFGRNWLQEGKFLARVGQRRSQPLQCGALILCNNAICLVNKYLQEGLLIPCYDPVCSDPLPIPVRCVQPSLLIICIMAFVATPWNQPALKNKVHHGFKLMLFYHGCSTAASCRWCSPTAIWCIAICLGWFRDSRSIDKNCVKAERATAPLDCPVWWLSFSSTGLIQLSQHENSLDIVNVRERTTSLLLSAGRKQEWIRNHFMMRSFSLG